MVLEARSLTKAVVPSTLFHSPSPANLQSTRLSLHVSEDETSCWVYIASDCHVYKLQISMEDSLLSKGKESLLIPQQTQVTHSSLVDRCPHHSEIQSVVLHETDNPGVLMLGSVDGYGQFIVSKIQNNGKEIDRLTYSVSPSDSGVGESSWAGLCFSPTQCSKVAVARSFCKSIDVYDQDVHMRTLRTHLYPTSLNFLKGSNLGGEGELLATTEGCQLSIWDLRMKENGGCVRRISGAVGNILYAVCCSSTGNIAVGGADRTVTIYDPRRWTPISNWVHCSKYEITGLAFSSLNPDCIYFQGVDYEVTCGHWRESRSIFSFRGDSNWLGFNKCSSRDVLAGWCDSGSIFVADIGDVEAESTMADIENERT